MKKYLVKFNSQLLINDSINGELNFKCVYGFLAPYDTDNDEKKGLLRTVEGTGTVEENHAAVRKALNL